MRSRRQRWISRTAAVLAVVFAVSGLPAGGSQAQVPDPNEMRVCDIDIYIINFQFTYQTGIMDEEGHCTYSRAPIPAGYLSAPGIGPIKTGPVLETYWVRNITNLDPVTHTLAQCGFRINEADCGLVPDPWWEKNDQPLTLGFNETKTFPGATTSSSFPSCVKYVYWTVKDPAFRWMRGLVLNSGWRTDTGNEPC